MEKIFQIPKLHRRFSFQINRRDPNPLISAKNAIKYVNVKVEGLSGENFEEFFQHLKLNRNTEVLSFDACILPEDEIVAIINSLSNLKELNIFNCNLLNPTNSAWTLEKLTSLTFEEVNLHFKSKVNYTGLNLISNTT